MKACPLDQLPVGNGVVDLKTGRLMPGHSSKNLSGGTTVPYHEDATCPLWESFLSRTTHLTDQVAPRTI
jgi:phage/plasmid-associated DNA primase